MSIQWQQLNTGVIDRDPTADKIRTGGQKLAQNYLLTLIHAGTINAGWFAVDPQTGATLGLTAVQIIQAAIDYAVANGYTAVWIPTKVGTTTLLPYDASQVTFSTSVQMQREGGRSDAQDVRAYGAALDTTTDDTAAVAAAVANAVAASDTGGLKSVYFDGLAKITSPVWVTGHGIRLVGRDQGWASERLVGTGHAIAGLYGSGYYGPLVIVENSDLTFPNLTTALVSGAGSAWNAGGNNSARISLNGLKYAQLNGLSQFCVECFFQTASTTTGDNLVGSSVQLLPSDPAHTCFFLRQQSGVAFFQLNLSGGVKTVSGGTLNDNVVHHVAGTYDGTTVRLFVDGTQVGSIAGSGTLVQDSVENVGVGSSGRYVLNQDRGFNSIGTLDSIRLSNTARYTSNFTAPTAKFTADSNTLALLNFVTQVGRFTQVLTKDNVYWAEHVKTVAVPSTAGVYGFRSEGMHYLSAVSGSNTGVFLGWEVSWPTFSRTTLGRLIAGIVGTHGNHFQWRINDLFVNADLNMLYAVGMGLNSPDGEIDTAWFFGSQYPVILRSSGNVAITNAHWICSTGGGNRAFLLYLASDVINSPITLRNVTVDSESGLDTTAKACLMAGGNPGGGVIATGCAFDFAQAVPPIWIDGTDMVRLTECLFYKSSGSDPASIFKTAGTLIRPAIVENCSQSHFSAFVPWTDTAGKVVLGKLGKHTAIAFSATPTFDASLRDSFEITITGNVTSSTLSNVTSGQRLTWRIIQSGGPWTFAWPTNVKGGGTVGSGSNVQEFEVGLDGNVYAVSAMQTGM